MSVRDARLTDDQKARIAGRLRQTVESSGVPGAALGIACGGDTWSTCAGVLTVGRAESVTPETRFMLGSVQKVVTAAMVLRLARSGDLDLDGSLADEFAQLEAVDPRLLEVTTRQLLNHSSGIDGDLMADFERGPDHLRDYLTAVSSVPLLHDPGRIFSYCNAGYALLGAILEDRLGVPFNAGAEKWFSDLGRAVTISRAAPPNAAAGHTRVGGRAEVTDNRLPSTLEAAGAQTWVCIDDVLALASAFVAHFEGASTGHLLDAKTIAAMQSATVNLPPHNPLGTAFGLGLFLDDWDGHDVIAHAGGASGYTANLVVMPDQRLAVCFLGNCQGNPAWPSVREAVFAEFGITPRSVPGPTEGMQLDESKARDYEGRFERRGQTVDVVSGADGLRLNRNSNVTSLGPIDERTLVELPVAAHPSVVHFHGSSHRPELMYIGVRALVRSG